MSDTFPIHELGAKGDGVHQSERGRLYVDRTLPGDVVRASLRQGDDDVWRGDLVEVVEPSSHRVEALCRHYDTCGGCTMQHATDAFYKDWKTRIVRDALAAKGLAPKIWRDPVFLPAGNRRRVTFAAFKKRNIVTLGYFRRRSHDVTDITSCLTADPAIMDLRAKLVTLLAPVLQEGKPADVFVQTVNGQFDLVITGRLGKTGNPDLQVHEAIAGLAHTANIDRVSWRVRERDAVEVMIETRPVLARFGALNVALPPLAFLQPTKSGEDALVAAVMGLLPEKGKFADIFSGCGTFAGPMLARGPVDAYDGSEAAVRALDKSKGALPLKATSRDLFRNPLRPDEMRGHDAVVFDPPRAGAQAQARALASGNVPLIIGVSCNPATFARDARALVDGGYTLESVKMVDQFTWSHHVELVAAFTKKSK